jgi:hypothetical protein
MADQRDQHSTKARLIGRIDNETLHQIERLAQLRRTSASQVGRCLIEDNFAARRARGLDKEQIALHRVHKD